MVEVTIICDEVERTEETCVDGVYDGADFDDGTTDETDE